MKKLILLLILSTYTSAMTLGEMKLCLSEESFRSNLEALAPNLTHISETFSGPVGDKINDAFMDTVEYKAITCSDIYDIAQAYEKKLEDIKNQINYINSGEVQVKTAGEIEAQAQTEKEIFNI